MGFSKGRDIGKTILCKHLEFKLLIRGIWSKTFSKFGPIHILHLKLFLRIEICNNAVRV